MDLEVTGEESEETRELVKSAFLLARSLGITTLLVQADEIADVRLVEGLRESERAELVLSLMRTLAAPEADITDEEVFRRDAELETGSVEPMLHDEFVRQGGLPIPLMRRIMLPGDTSPLL